MSVFGKTFNKIGFQQNSLFSLLKAIAFDYGNVEVYITFDYNSIETYIETDVIGDN